MAIDIGPGATDMDSMSFPGYTRPQPQNPANADGTLDTFEAWFVTDGAGFVIGTFSSDGSSKFTARDYENIGNVTAGSKQTFTGKNCDVKTDDWLGCYWSSGMIERSSSGGTTNYYKSGNQFGAGQQTYSAEEGFSIISCSIYATGTETSVGWTHITKVNGIASANIAKVNGIAVANIAKVNGIAV